MLNTEISGLHMKNPLILVFRIPDEVGSTTVEECGDTGGIEWIEF